MIERLNQDARATGTGLVGGGARRNRTADLLNAIQALYQLSYGPSRTRGSKPREVRLTQRRLYRRGSGPTQA